MTPIFRVQANTTDVTQRIAAMLVELETVDEAGSQSDRLTIHLADPGPVPTALPPYGADLHVALGYEETELVEVGKFRFDEGEVSYDHSRGRQIVLRARASDPDNKKPIAGYIAKHTHSWVDHTLGDIVNEIANEHGFTPRCAVSLVNERPGPLHQVGQSDSDFLTRLAATYGAVAKVSRGNLIVAPYGKGKSVSGIVLPVIDLTADQLTSWRYIHAARGKIKSVVAHWRDRGTGVTHRVRAGKGEPHHVIRQLFLDAPTALRNATALLKGISTGLGRLSITLPGNPRLQAETQVNLIGVDDQIDGPWTIHRVTHRLSVEVGYHCLLDCELTEADTVAEEGIDYGAAEE